MSDEPGPRGPREWLQWIRTTDNEAVVYAREILTSVAAVLLVGLLLFAISGVWPPMVAVESSSMDPHMKIGDLVFVMEEHRLSPEYAAGDTGVVTAETGENEGYRKFKEPGDVIIYRPDNRSGTPIIHRAHFWVDEGENWYDRANPEYIGGADDCQELQHCPAPHGGFITKGDNAGTNRQYDQVNGVSLSGPVKPGWIVGTAEASIPVLGYVKLCASGGPCPLFTVGPPGSSTGAPEAVVQPVVPENGPVATDAVGQQNATAMA